MLLAAWLGNSTQLPDGLSALIEPGIAVSLLALGLLLARPAAMPQVIVIALLPVLVVAHGLAHGTEGSAAAGMAYLAGLGLSTLSLHVLGLWLAPRMTPLLTGGLSLLMLGSGAWALL
jgi:urease accessory protein